MLSPFFTTGIIYDSTIKLKVNHRESPYIIAKGNYDQYVKKKVKLL